MFPHLIAQNFDYITFFQDIRLKILNFQPENFLVVFWLFFDGRFDGFDRTVKIRRFPAFPAYAYKSRFFTKFYKFFFNFQCQDVWNQAFLS